MNLLLYTVFDSRYAAYWPLWSYCIGKAYPDYRTHAELIEGKIPFAAACLRFLKEPPVDFEDVYITDIDMLILPETPTIEEYHRSEMAETGLCYSNSPRTLSEQHGPSRLTGLHYCTREWYERTAVDRGYYRVLVDEGVYGNGKFDDELALMDICSKSGVGLPPLRNNLASRHHGIHLGTIRDHRKDRNELRTSLMMRISPRQARQYQALVADVGYLRVCEQAESMSRVVGEELDILAHFTQWRARGKE